MDIYEKMEEEMHEFKKYLKMTMDLLCDSYKWKTLADYADDENSKQKYKNISNELYEMFMQEYNNINAMFKGD